MRDVSASSGCLVLPVPAVSDMRIFPGIVLPDEVNLLPWIPWGNEVLLFSA